MKYIIHKGGTRLEKIEIFCEEDNHIERAMQLGILDGVVSAGFIRFDGEGEVHCGGVSTSLSEGLGRAIESRGEADEKVFKFHNRMANKMGVV